MRASEMRKGQTVTFDGKLYAIVDYQHVKLGKGGAVYQTKLKSLTDGSIQNIRLRSEETVEEAYLDKRTYEYLYSSAHLVHSDIRDLLAFQFSKREPFTCPANRDHATCSLLNAVVNKPSEHSLGSLVEVAICVEWGRQYRIDPFDSRCLPHCVTPPQCPDCVHELPAKMRVSS